MASVPFVDTSFLVRYLTNDPPELAARAAEVLDREPHLTISPVALAETAFVLESFYQSPRAAVVDALIRLVQKANLEILHLPKSRALMALDKCRPSRRHSFADALIWTEAVHARASVIFSFDRRFPRGEVKIHS
jgi:predicted nucleic acid-binding protein